MLKVALTNLGKYVEGELIYKYLYIPYTDEELQETLNKIKIDKVWYEEYFILYFETDISGLKIEEYEDLNMLNEQMKKYENLSEYDKELVQAILEAECKTFDEAINCVEEGNCTLYEVDEPEDLAQNFVEEGYYGDIDKMGILANYIDFEKLGRDIMFAGNYYEVSQGILCIG